MDAFLLRRTRLIYHGWKNVPYASPLGYFVNKLHALGFYAVGILTNIRSNRNVYLWCHTFGT